MADAGGGDVAVCGGEKTGALAEGVNCGLGEVLEEGARGVVGIVGGDGPFLLPGKDTCGADGLVGGMC